MVQIQGGFFHTTCRKLAQNNQRCDVLDPFSGSGTAVLTACKMGMRSTGMDVMPVGNIAAGAISTVLNNLSEKEIRDAADTVLGNRTGAKPFQHVGITRMAFPPDTERALSYARHAIGTIKNKNARNVMDFACMCILEESVILEKTDSFCAGIVGREGT